MQPDMLHCVSWCEPSVLTRKCCAGHFITYIQISGKWFCFDDTAVVSASQRDVEGCFGDANTWSFHNDMHAYLLFYRLLQAPSSASDTSPASVTTRGN